MNGTPPTPETSVSLFVAGLVLLAGLIVVLTLLVVRRRQRRMLNFVLGLVTLVVLGVGGIYLIVPPQVPAAGQPGRWQRCPYDRLVWSNMGEDVSEEWQACRQAARGQTALILLGASALTVGAARVLLRRLPPQRTGGRTVASAVGLAPEAQRRR